MKLPPSLRHPGMSHHFAEGDPCPQCPEGKEGQLVSRPARPYPVVTQLIFGVSFVLFIVLFDRIQPHRTWVWAWSAVQTVIGIVLVYQRRRASRRILHCIRCGQDLR